jgi:hypothetical protein
MPVGWHMPVMLSDASSFDAPGDVYHLLFDLSQKIHGRVWPEKDRAAVKRLLSLIRHVCGAGSALSVSLCDAHRAAAAACIHHSLGLPMLIAYSMALLSHTPLNGDPAALACLYCLHLPHPHPVHHVMSPAAGHVSARRAHVLLHAVQASSRQQRSAARRRARW